MPTRISSTQGESLKDPRTKTPQKAGSVPQTPATTESDRDAAQQQRPATMLVIAPTRRELGGSKDTTRVSVGTVGIGRRSGLVLASLLEEHQPDLILSLGFAGALRPGLPTGTLTLHPIVISEAESLAQMTCTSKFSGPASAALGAAGVPCQEGPLLTVERPVLTSAEKRRHACASGAVAADMEGYWLARAASQAEVPLLAVRAILDEAAHDLPSFVEAIIDDDGKHEWLHALHALRQPRDAASLGLLALRAFHAAHALRKAVRLLTPALLTQLRIMR